MGIAPDARYFALGIVSSVNGGNTYTRGPLSSGSPADLESDQDTAGDAHMKEGLLALSDGSWFFLDVRYSMGVVRSLRHGDWW